MRQQYGQNFLVNQGIIKKILDATLPLCAAAGGAGTMPKLVEIGPGKGALTLGFAADQRTPKDFTAVEIDPAMVDFLTANPALQDRLEIINQDFLSFDLNSLPAKPTVFVSNLPYIHAAEILDKVLNFKHFFAAVFMFQREQALRITAAAGSDFYGPISIMSQARAEVKSLTRVSRGSFSPAPKVESEVLIFTAPATPHVVPNSYALLQNIVRGAFAHKRKNILNSLSETLLLPKNIVADNLNLAAIDPASRAEDVTVVQYICLSNVWKND